MEHVRDVKPALASLERFMTGRALIYVEVPDASRYAAFAWSPFQDFNSEHINHFSLASLDNLLRQAGLPADEGRSQGHPVRAGHAVSGDLLHGEAGRQHLAGHRQGHRPD